MRRAVNSVKRLILILFLSVGVVTLSNCAIFGGGEDPAQKNPNVKFTAPPAPFEEVPVAGADRVWQSHKTGNTIAFNSACDKEIEKESLAKLEDGILSGVDNVKITRQENIKVDGAPAVRTRAEGSTEKTMISVELITIKKGNCTYDLAYAARKNLFASEAKQFAQFVERFQVP